LGVVCGTGSTPVAARSMRQWLWESMSRSVRSAGLGGLGFSGWGGGGEAAGGFADQLPAALMDGPVKGPADQGQVVQVGGATIQPMPHMMGFAPGQGRLQPGKTQP